MLYYKILEQNGIENENIDGAGFNNFCAGDRNGIIKGILNECVLFKKDSNTIAFTTGEVIIKGVRIKFEEDFEKTFSSVPAEEIAYQIVFRVTVERNNRGIDFDVIVREFGELTQDNIYEKENGVYEVEFGNFILSVDGIEYYNRTMQVITGATGENESVVTAPKLYRHTLTLVGGSNSVTFTMINSKEEAYAVSGSGVDDLPTVISDMGNGIYPCDGNDPSAETHYTSCYRNVSNTNSITLVSETGVFTTEYYTIDSDTVEEL